MSNNNGNPIDIIAAERMRLAGLHVPGDVSPAQTAWERDLIRENNAREMAAMLLNQRDLTVDQAFEVAVEFVDKAFARMDAIQRQKPTGRGDAPLVTQ
jgi:hypothetical protein